MANSLRIFFWVSVTASLPCPFKPRANLLVLNYCTNLYRFPHAHLWEILFLNCILVCHLYAVGTMTDKITPSLQPKIRCLTSFQETLCHSGYFCSSETVGTNDRFPPIQSSADTLIYPLESQQECEVKRPVWFTEKTIQKEGPPQPEHHTKWQVSSSTKDLHYSAYVQEINPDI